MLRPTTEYFITQQQNAYVSFCCWSCKHSVVDRDNKIGTLLLALAYSVVDQMDNLLLYHVNQMTKTCTSGK